MSDIIFESLRVVILLYAFFYLVKAGMDRIELCQKGWNLVLGGVGLLLFASIMDVSDNFESLNRFVVIGNTPVQAFLEKMVGSLGGVTLLTFGLVKWIPTITGVGRIDQIDDELKKEVTERKRAEKELLETSQQLGKVIAQAKMAYIVKSGFLANKNHKIEMPINEEIGMTEPVMDSDLDEQQQSYIKMISNEADELPNLIKDVLDFSKIEPDKPDLEEIPHTFEDLAGSLAIRADKKGTDLASDLEPDFPVQITGDPGRLWQILMNPDTNTLAKKKNLKDINVDAKVKAILTIDSDKFYGVIEDMSVNGLKCYFNSNHFKINIGDRITIEYTLPSKSKDVDIIDHCTVKWVKDDYFGVQCHAQSEQRTNPRWVLGSLSAA